MSTVIKDTRKIFVNNSTGGGSDPALDTRVTVLENNEYKITYFESVSSSSGTLTIPTGATILLDQFQGGVDAYVSTISNGQPTGLLPQTAGGTPVDVSSFDALGNYTLTGTPSSYPVAIIYILKIKAVDYNNLTVINILDLESYELNAALLLKASIVPRVTSITSSATPSIDTSLYDILNITALATAITGVTISGARGDFQPLLIIVKDNGTARAIALGSSFVAMGEAIPTTTTINKTTTMAFLWYPSISKYGCIGAKTEA